MTYFRSDHFNEGGSSDANGQKLAYVYYESEPRAPIKVRQVFIGYRTPMPKLRIFLIIVIVLAGIVALWLFGAALMRAFLREARPAHDAARLGEENPPDRNWALGAHAYRGQFHDIAN
jgi:hypothetical protein